MFSSQIYQNQNLSNLYNEHLTNSKAIKHIQIQSTQRALLINTIHMLLNMSSDIFQYSEISQQKYFNLSSQGIQLFHLSSISVKVCLEEFLEYGKQMQYVKYQSKRIYQFNNALIKAFAENAMEIIKMIEIWLTDKLKKIQQESGRIQRNELQYQSSQNQPITLLSLLQDLKMYGHILNFIVSILNRLALKQNASSEDLQKSVLFLLNIYFQECSKQYCLKDLYSKNYLHILYKNIMREYFKICKDWFQMNQKTLAMKVHFGFFVELDQILTSDEEKIFDVEKITKRQSIPQLFKRNYRKIIELGKTIQFIKLYFGPQERENYNKFMNIQGQFQVLFQFLYSLSYQKPEQYVFFKPKALNYITISRKLSTIVKPNVKLTEITTSNPFKMYPQLSGVLNLRSDYQFRQKQTRKQYKQTMVSSRVKKMIDFSGLDVNNQIQITFNQILQRITVKCLTILQKDRIRDSIGRTLKGIKKIMLFQQGDFIEQFMDLTRDLLQKPSQKISRNNIQRLIEQAVRSSGAKQLSQIIRENISFTFLKNTQGIKGWRIFSMMYKPEKPTHCIFTKVVMNDYGNLSNMIFNLRHCETVLIQIWSNFSYEGLGMILKARNAVHHYVKALQSFIFSQVEELWTELLDQIGKNGNILTIIEVNENILQKMKAITFENKDLCNCLHSLLKVVDRFQNIFKNLKDGNDENLKNDIDQIWSWFLAILDQSRQINNFCDTFDFRADYSI